MVGIGLWSEWRVDSYNSMLALKYASVHVCVSVLRGPVLALCIFFLLAYSWYCRNQSHGSHTNPYIIVYDKSYFHNFVYARQPSCWSHLLISVVMFGMR